MNYSELIYEFFDGTLDSEREETLFAALRTQADVRAEFKGALLLTAATRNNRALFAPSLAATQGVFERLGFTAPITPTISSAPTALPSSASSILAAANTATSATQMLKPPVATSLGLGATALGAFWLKYRQAFVSGTIAALGTAVFFLWDKANDAANDAELYRSLLGNQQQIGQMYDTRGNGRGFGNGNDNGSDAGFGEHPGFSTNQQFASSDTTHERVIVREIVREIFRQAPNNHASAQQYVRQHDGANLEAQSENSQSSSQASPQTLPSQTESPQTAARTVALLPVTTPLTNTAPKTVEAASSQNPYALLPSESPAVQAHHKALTEPFGLRAELRGMLAQSFPAVSVEAGKIPFFNNIALSLMYALSPNHSVGLEAGQEAFGQSFRSFSENTPYIVEQNPVLFWAGLAYRYTLLPESQFSPFVHAVLGGTTVGALGKTIVGVSYSPDARTQFTLGAEGTGLLYGHQNAYYITRKIGMTYGVSVKF